VNPNRASWLLPTAIVAVLTAIGGIVRLVVLHDSLFADELSTYWIISGRSLGGVVSTVHTDAEITPPLFFVLSWLTTRLDLSAEMLRLPSFIAGVAAIPLVYLVGSRTVGRIPALLATALTALSPFMIYYSAEARGYELVIVLSLLSTLAMLAAIDDRRGRWWVLYGASSCAAVYSHYTAVFVLGAQLLWLLWVHPEARRAALLANGAAVIGFLPWIMGLIADLNSPTTKILGALEPFRPNTVGIALEHWSIGYPYRFVHLESIPGDFGLILIGAGIVLAMIAIAVRGRWHLSLLRGTGRRVRLIVMLALAAPVGEAVVSLVGSDVFGTRNLAVSWPGIALVVSTFVSAGRDPLRIAAATLLVAGFGVGAARMLEPAHQRPDYEAAARFIDRSSSPPDVVIDAGVLSPGPFNGLDLALEQPRRVVRAEAPQERDHPFGFADQILPLRNVTRRAAGAAKGARIFLVTLPTDEQFIPGRPTYSHVARVLTQRPPPGYRDTVTRTYPGIVPIRVSLYEYHAGGREGR
jgi:hypothetical protein